MDSNAGVRVPVPSPLHLCLRTADLAVSVQMLGCCIACGIVGEQTSVLAASCDTKWCTKGVCVKCARESRGIVCQCGKPMVSREMALSDAVVRKILVRTPSGCPCGHYDYLVRGVPSIKPDRHVCERSVWGKTCPVASELSLGNIYKHVLDCDHPQCCSVAFVLAAESKKRARVTSELNSKLQDAYAVIQALHEGHDDDDGDTPEWVSGPDPPPSPPPPAAAAAAAAD